MSHVHKFFWIIFCFLCFCFGKTVWKKTYERLISLSLFTVLWFYRDPNRIFWPVRLLRWVCTMHYMGVCKWIYQIYQMDISKVSHLSPIRHLINHHIKAREWLCKLAQYWYYTILVLHGLLLPNYGKYFFSISRPKAIVQGFLLIDLHALMYSATKYQLSVLHI